MMPTQKYGGVMPYANHWEPHGLVREFSGFVSREEFVQSMRLAAADPRFDDLHFAIYDCSRMTGHDLDERILDGVALTSYGAKLTNPNIRVLVVGADSRIAALAAAASRDPRAAGYEAHAFATMALARAWLASQPLGPVFVRPAS
jgi:hypothetical protein